MSLAHQSHPEFEYFHPLWNFLRKAGIAFALISFAVIGGALVLWAGHISIADMTLMAARRNEIPSSAQTTSVRAGRRPPRLQEPPLAGRPARRRAKRTPGPISTGSASPAKRANFEARVLQPTASSVATRCRCRLHPGCRPRAAPRGRLSARGSQADRSIEPCAQESAKNGNQPDQWRPTWVRAIRRCAKSACATNDGVLAPTPSPDSHNPPGVRTVLGLVPVIGHKPLLNRI